MRRLVITAASCALFAASVWMSDADAQTAYPAKSIRFIVPVTTGGPSDIVARLIGEKLSTTFGA
jgi:tripartite-type tricarboxylate transporter receptor subunit TctC